jgi:hypothetical protein
LTARIGSGVACLGEQAERASMTKTVADTANELFKVGLKGVPLNGIKDCRMRISKLMTDWLVI